MGFLDAVGRFLALPSLAEPVQTRSEVVPSTLAEFVGRIGGVRDIPWRYASINEAMGVPAIFASVNLIANTAGALTLRAFRNGAEMANDQRPRLIVRPNPLTTTRDFFRDTVYSMATRGEAWWWIAKRDPLDNSPLSLLVVPAREIVVTENEKNRLEPRIEWLGTKMPNEDMRQITLLREPGELRGFGPLQKCQAAVSVAVESQEWAANFYADSGYPSVLIKHAGELSGEEDEDGYNEADRLRNQWIEKPNNVPRVIDQNIESVDTVQPNSQGAQMLDARSYQVGEIVRMFGMDASLLAYATPGSSLTYQNVGQAFDKFIRTTLWPMYLEGIEQELSDMLTRSTVARFNLDAFTRADIKTRFEVYESGKNSGVLSVEEARQMEGLDPGDVENAPVPLSPPQAVPTILPVQNRSAPEMREVRCGDCGRLAGKVAGAAEIRCSKCGTMVVAA